MLQLKIIYIYSNIAFYYFITEPENVIIIENARKGEELIRGFVWAWSKMSSSMVDLEVILLGEVGVGKTTLFLYLDKNKFVDEQTRSTVGVDIMYKTVRVDDRELTVSQ